MVYTSMRKEGEQRVRVFIFLSVELEAINERIRLTARQAEVYDQSIKGGYVCP